MSGILFVDDEPDNVELVAEILAEALELEVEVVESVEQAVERLHERPWQLVVMDLFIPLGDHPDRVLGPRARRDLVALRNARRRAGAGARRHRIRDR